MGMSGIFFIFDVLVILTEYILELNYIYRPSLVLKWYVLLLVPPFISFPLSCHFIVDLFMLIFFVFRMIRLLYFVSLRAWIRILLLKKMDDLWIIQYLG